MLAELSILGPFICIQERLFYRRTNSRNNNEGNSHEILLYKPWRTPRFMFREWRVAFENFLTIQRAPVRPHIKLKLLRAWLGWVVSTRASFKEEAKELVKQQVRHFYHGTRGGS